MKVSSNLEDRSLTIKKGWIIHFGDKSSLKTFRIIDIDQTGGGAFICENVYSETSEPITFSIDEIFNASESPYPTFSPNLETLNIDLSRKEEPFEDLAPEAAISKKLLKQAEKIIWKYEKVETELNHLLRLQKLTGAKVKKEDLVEQACERVNLLPQITGFDNQKGMGEIHKSTFYTYRRLYVKCQGDKVQLASRLHRISYRRLKINSAALNFVDTIILQFVAGGQWRLNSNQAYIEGSKILATRKNYWVDPSKCVDGKVPQNLIEELINLKIPLDSILANPENRAILTKIKKPSKVWFYKYSRWFVHNPNLSESEIRKRYGDDFYENEILVFNTFVNKAQYPLQFVFADHCLLDVFIIDKGTRKEVFRVWLTVLIDAFSRSVVGFALLDEDPSVESIQTALRNAIFPKGKLLKSLGIDEKLTWPCFGIPLSLYLDNAWAHLSLSLENFARAISQKGKCDSIEIVLRPPFMGRYGAIIERFFGNLQYKLKKFLIGSIKNSKPDSIRSARNQACLLYEDLNKTIVKMIVEYQNTKHSELDGMTPNQKWQQGLQARVPKIPNLKESDPLFWRSYPETRFITDKGLHLFGMEYTSSLIEMAERIDAINGKIPYGIKYSTSDISRIAVFRDSVFIGMAQSKKLTLQDGNPMPLSITERNLARKIAEGNNDSSENWTDYLIESQETSSQRLKEKNRINRKGKNITNETISSSSLSEPSSEAKTAKSTPPTPEANQLYTDLLLGFNRKRGTK